MPLLGADGLYVGAAAAEKAYVGAEEVWAAGGGGGGFDPLSITWAMAYWGSDPAWTPPSDGAAVTSWPDASGNSFTASQATGTRQPLYRAASANFNSKPCVEFDGVDDWLITTGADDLAQPNEIVIVTRVLSNTAGPSGRHIFDGRHGSLRHTLWTTPGGTHWAMGAGSSRTSDTGLYDTNTHHWRLIFDDSAPVMELDGTNLSLGGTTLGLHGIDGVSLGDRYDGTRPANVQIAFLGVSDAALTATERANLLAWSRSFYGTP